MKTNGFPEKRPDDFGNEKKYGEKEKYAVEIEREEEEEEEDPWKISTVYVKVVPWSGKFYKGYYIKRFSKEVVLGCLSTCSRAVVV